MRPDADPLISVAEAARELNLNKSTLSRQIRAGAIRSHDGKVRLSEVLEDRANNIDLTRSARGEGSIDAIDAAPAEKKQHSAERCTSLHQPADATADATIEAADATLAEGEDRILVDGALLSYGEARAMKETYLARLRKLQFDKERGELAPVAAMVAFNERVFGVVRDARRTRAGLLQLRSCAVADPGAGPAGQRSGLTSLGIAGMVPAGRQPAETYP